MKKIILALTISIAIAFSTQAQLLPTFDLGVKGGLNFTSLKTDGNYFSSDTKAGFLAGVWGRVGVLGLHVQPELYYTTKNSTLQADGQEEDVKFSTVDLPILLGTKFGLGGIGGRIQAGPLFSFIVDKDNPRNVFNEDVNFKDRSSAFVAGAGLDIANLGIDLRYEFGLGNINRNSNKQRLNLWTISLAYNFL